MVNLDQAQKNVRNAQDQLDQALKELEKAKKGWADVLEFPHGVRLSDADRFSSGTVFFTPCKVTVRPLGGPEPVVFRAAVATEYFGYTTPSPKGTVTVSGYGLEHLIGKICRVTVEEVVE